MTTTTQITWHGWTITLNRNSTLVDEPDGNVLAVYGTMQAVLSTPDADYSLNEAALEALRVAINAQGPPPAIEDLERLGAIRVHW